MLPDLDTKLVPTAVAPIFNSWAFEKSASSE